MPPQSPDPPGHDLRMPVLGALAWFACLIVGWDAVPGLVGVVGLAALTCAGLLVLRRTGIDVGAALVAAALIVIAACAFSAAIRVEAVARSPTAALADDGAVVDLVGVVVSDPRPVKGRFSDRVAVRVNTAEVTARGLVHRVGSPILVLGPMEWDDVVLGSRIRATARLASADDDGLAAIALAVGTPQQVQGPDFWWRGASRLRAAIRAAVAHRPPEQAALVPALVDGDDADLPADVVVDFRVTGLTHLTAVSGANLTLVVGFLLTLARWCGVRGRWLGVVAALGIVGFVLLARTEPSVLRAAAMGTVGVLALGVDGRRRAFSGLGVAVVGLLLLQPELARSVGFALSVLATAGIVVLAPPFRDAMAGWMPRWLAEAIAVPAAAQLACTPIVAAISGQVSVVAVLANLLAGPAVGPATVLGLLGGLFALIWLPVGALVGSLASWCVAWIVWVARTGAALPGAAVDWSVSLPWLVLLTLLCLLLAGVGVWLLRRPGWLALVLTGTMLAGPLRPSGAWADDGWVLAACDVGQGDSLVLRAGPRAAVLVDVGPDSAAVDDCLEHLGVEQIPLIVLTHFHADHIAGLTGALRGRRVGAIWVTPVLDPMTGAEEVQRTAAAAGVPVRVAPSGSFSVGMVRLTRLWPPPQQVRAGPGDGTAANDASLVFAAEFEGLTVLLTGDVEPAAQAVLARHTVGLRVDVVKVPHHGSRYQDLPWLTSLDATLALVSVGEDNDYGHPSAGVVEALESAGTTVARTDLDGTLLVAPGDHGPRLHTHG